MDPYILVIDSNVYARNILSEFLTRHTHKVATYASLEAALALEKDCPALCLLGARTPSALEGSIQALRDQWGNLPVMVLGDKDVVDRHNYVSEIIPTSTLFPDLLSAIRRVLRQLQNPNGLRQPEVSEDEKR